MSFLEHLQQVQNAAETIHSRHEVEEAIARVGKEISADISGDNPVVLTLLNGGIIFCGKLLVELPFPLQLDSVSVGRYRGETRGSEIRWRLKPSIALKERTVLLVDDILDEGITLAEVRRFCREEGAARVLIAVLVDKKLAREKPCRADYIGLEADDRYLFGFGMDYKDYLRNAAGIFACTHL